MLWNKRLVNIIIMKSTLSFICLGFTFSHSASGGTGSGLSMRIFDQCQSLLTPTYGGIWFFTVFPSKKISNTVIEPYNTVCVLDKLREAENVTRFLCLTVWWKSWKRSLSFFALCTWFILYIFINSQLLAVFW